MDTEGTCLVSIFLGVRFNWALKKKNVTDTRCIDIKKTKRKKGRNKNCSKKAKEVKLVQ